MKAASSIVFAIMALVICAAAEELLPKIASIGFPFLLCATLWFANSYRAGRTETTPAEQQKRAGGARVDVILFAIAAGAMEETLSLLPAGTAATYFALTSAVCGNVDIPLPFPATAALAWGVFQLWLWIWLGGAMSGAVYLRFAAALPMAAATAAATGFLASRGIRETGLAQ